MKLQRADNLKPDQAIDPVDPDRSAEQDELDFDDAVEPSFQDLAPDYEFELLDEESDSETVDNNGTDDDLTPENLIPEDGSRSPYEPGGSIPSDESLSIVSEDEIGEGYGLDEAELARVDPLDGKPE